MNLSYWIKLLLMPVKIIFFVIADWVAVSVVNKCKSSSEPIMLVREDAIGDFVLWLNSARTMRDHFVGRQIVLVCNKVCEDLASATGLFDDVYGIDTTAFANSLRYRWQMMRKVAGLGASLAIQPTFSRVLLSGDALIRASRAPERIGSIGDLSNRYHWHRWIGDRWYTTLIPACPRPMMELERNTEFLRCLGIKRVVPEVAKMPVVAALPSALRRSDHYFVIFPGASTVGKMWPAAAFARTADVVHDLYGWQPVVCGSKAELAIAAKVVKYSNHANWVDFTGGTTLLEFIEILRGARLVISNDTSAAHIAASVATPSVCVMGGGHFGRFMPYAEDVPGMKPVPVYRSMECFGCNWRCRIDNDPLRPFPCVEAVQVDDVIGKVKEVIEMNMSRVEN